MSRRRWLVVLLVPLVLAVGLLIDVQQDDDDIDAGTVATEAGTDLTRMMPVASGSEALSSTWYCAAGTAAEGGAANQTIVIFNPSDVPRSGTITAIPSEGEPKTVTQEVAPRAQVRVAITDLVQAPYASAVVEFRGGEVVVEHVVRGPLGLDAGPCATSASDQWHFAAGASTIDAIEVIVLFNPFPAPATVDIAYAVDGGGQRRTPSAFTGLQVPARSVVAASARDLKVLRPLEQVSATVVARSGEVVAERILTYDGQGPEGPDKELPEGGFRPKGLAVTLGVPRPAETWMFPFGVKADGQRARFVVYNPGPDEAEVEVAVSLDDPDRNGEVDPFSVTINPRAWVVVDMDAESRIPSPVRYSTVVTSRNRVPVVVERVISSTAPLATEDIAISPGTPLVSDRWVFAAGSNSPRSVNEWIAVSNPGSTSVVVQIGAVIEGQVQALDEAVGTVKLGPRARRVVPLPAALDARQVALLVSADRPIAAERVLVRPEGARWSTANGVPAGDGELRLAPLTAAG